MAFVCLHLLLLGRLALTVSALVGSRVSCVCVCALLPGEVEDSDAIDTLGQLDGPDSPLPTLKGKIESQLAVLAVVIEYHGVSALPLSLGARPA